MTISPPVTGDRDDPTRNEADAVAPSARLRAVQGPLPPDAGDAPPPVRLRREFKGLTVADLQREDVARLLPGVLRSALSYIEAGDYAAAERALPGQLATVHDGPGHQRRARRAWVVPLVVSLSALGALACVACWVLS